MRPFRSSVTIIWWTEAANLKVALHVGLGGRASNMCA